MVERIECGNIGIDSLFKKNWDKLPEEKQLDINRRIDDFKRKYAAVSRTAAERKVPLNQNAAALEVVEEAMRLTHQASISPGTARGLGYHLAMTFGQEHALLGLADDLSEVGKARRLLADLKRRGGGSMHEILRQIGYIDESIEAEKAFRKLRRRTRVDEETWTRLKLDAVEIGNMKYTQKDLAIVGPEGLALLKQRQKRFYDNLKAAGLSSDVAEEFLDIAKRVQTSNRQTLEILNSFGVNIQDASELQGYLPRNFSPQAIQRITWTKNDKNSFTFYDITGKPVTESLPSTFSKSRVAEHYVIEDAALLETIFESIAPEQFKVYGGINAMLEDTRKLHSFVRDVLPEKLGAQSAEVVDSLIDMGYMSRIPMTSTELFDYMKQRYQLPFKHLNELMQTDFGKMANLYRNQAKLLAGRSFIAHGTFRAAIEEGWGVTSVQRTLDMDTYGDWVQLTGTRMTNHDTVIPYAQGARFLKENAIIAGSRVYVHPVVADLYKAQTRVLSDPNQMGFISRFIWDVQSKYKAMGLFTSGFVFRQLYTPVFQIWAGGGRLDTYFNDMRRVMSRAASLKIQRRSLDTFDEVFDDTKKIYKFREGEFITERQLWRETLKSGLASEVVPWLGAAAERPYYKPSTNVVETIRRHANYTRDVLNRRDKLGFRGVAAGLYRQGSDAVDNFSDKLFHGTLITNVLFDNVGRFALMKALTDDTTTNKAIRAAQGNFRYHLDFDEASERVRQFFFLYDDPGQFDGIMKHVYPYWMFMSRNTFSIFRMMVREPGKFMAYQRLFAAFNEAEDTEDVPKGAVPGWTGSPLVNHVWVRRDENDNPVEIFSLPRSQMDPVAEGVESVTGMADIVLSMFGIWPEATGGTIDDRLNDLDWSSTRTNRALNQIFQGTYPPLQQAYIEATAALTGNPVNPRTGQEIPTGPLERTDFLGIRMHPIQRLRYENLFPVLRNIDRSNPGNLFGTPPEFDEEGNLIKEGTPSWTGGRRKPRSSDFRTWWQRTLAVVGFNVYSFDVMEQLGWRQVDIEKALEEGTWAINDQIRIVEESVGDEQRFNREYETLQELKALHMSLALDYYNIQAWADQRGLQFPQAIRQIEQMNMREHSVRGLTPEQEDKLIDAVYGTDLGIESFDGIFE